MYDQIIVHVTTTRHKCRASTECFAAAGNIEAPVAAAETVAVRVVAAVGAGGMPFDSPAPACLVGL